MESFKKYLEQFPNYTPEVFELARPYLKVREIAAKDYFVSHGKVCRHIAYIEEGLLRLYYLNDGKEVTNCFCEENTITTSYSSLITQAPSDLALQAIEHSKLIVLSVDSLHELYKRSSFWQMLGRIAAENEFVTTECHQRFLRDRTAAEKYSYMLENQGSLLQRIPLYYLATYLQITPETLSRIRNNMTRLRN